jgi:NAD(P)-dependent dehydrogenase (short-subunit alcohol dehydrogenase family)
LGKLDGKVAFLTGAGAGIAKATALLMAAEGAKVAIAEINPEAGARAEAQVREAGGEATFYQVDVTDDAAVKQAIDATVAKYGGLHVLMNCAGGSLQEDVPVHEMDLAIWHKTINLNLLHPFLCCRHAIPHMLASGSGSIINLASHLGLMGSVKPAYAASKGGIVSFTKTLAAQYVHHNIRANAIAPGVVRTERSIARGENPAWLADTSNPAVRERNITHGLYPFSVGEPQDIAAIALFLASDDSRMLTGTTIAADGGRSSYLSIYSDSGS